MNLLRIGSSNQKKNVDLIIHMKEQLGTTVFITTHYMEEQHRLTMLSSSMMDKSLLKAPLELKKSTLLTG